MVNSVLPGKFSRLYRPENPGNPAAIGQFALRESESHQGKIPMESGFPVYLVARQGEGLLSHGKRVDGGL
jgi:hypothetical protein